MSLPSRDFPAYSSRWGQSVGTPAVTPVSLHDSDEDSPVPHPLPPSSVSIMDAKHYRTASTGDMLHSVDRLHSSQMSSSRGGVTALKSTEFRNPQAQDGFFSPSVRGGAWHNAKSISSMADAIEDTRSTIHALSKSKEEAELDKELTARELERTRKEVAVLQHQLKNLNQSAMTKASPSFAESITPEIARVLTAAEEEIVRLRGEKEQWRVKVESLEQELAVSRDQSALVATQASIEHESQLDSTIHMHTEALQVSEALQAKVADGVRRRKALTLMVEELQEKLRNAEFAAANSNEEARHWRKREEQSRQQQAIRVMVHYMEAMHWKAKAMAFARWGKAATLLSSADAMEQTHNTTSAKHSMELFAAKRRAAAFKFHVAQQHWARRAARTCISFLRGAADKEKRLRQFLERKALVRRHRSQAAAFRAWRLHVRTTRTFQRQLQRVEAHRRRVLLIRGFWKWQVNAFHQRHQETSAALSDRVQYAQSILHATRRALIERAIDLLSYRHEPFVDTACALKAFNGWKAVAQRKMKARRAAAALLQRKAQQQLRRQWEQWQLAGRQRRCLRRVLVKQGHRSRLQCLSAALLKWQRHGAAAVLYALQHQRHHEVAALQEELSTWQGDAARRKAEQQRQRAVVQLHAATKLWRIVSRSLHTAPLQRGFSQWRARTAVLSNVTKLRFTVGLRSLERFLTRKLTIGVYQMKHALGKWRHRTAVLTRVVRALARYGKPRLRSAFLQWQRNAKAEQHRLQRLRHVALRGVHQQLSFGWRAWRQWMQGGDVAWARRQRIKRIMLRWMRHKELQAWRVWHDHTLLCRAAQSLQVHRKEATTAARAAHLQHSRVQHRTQLALRFMQWRLMHERRQRCKQVIRQLLSHSAQAATAWAFGKLKGMSRSVDARRRVLNKLFAASRNKLFKGFYLWKQNTASSMAHALSQSRELEISLRQALLHQRKRKSIMVCMLKLMEVANQRQIRMKEALLLWRSRSDRTGSMHSALRRLDRVTTRKSLFSGFQQWRSTVAAKAQRQLQQRLALLRLAQSHAASLHAQAAMRASFARWCAVCADAAVQDVSRVGVAMEGEIRAVQVGLYKCNQSLQGSTTLEALFRHAHRSVLRLFPGSHACLWVVDSANAQLWGLAPHNAFEVRDGTQGSSDGAAPNMSGMSTGSGGSMLRGQGGYDLNVTGASRGSHLSDSDANSLVLDINEEGGNGSSQKGKGKRTAKPRVPLKNGLVGACFAAKAPLLAMDALSDPRYDAQSDVAVRRCVHEAFLRESDPLRSPSRVWLSRDEALQEVEGRAATSLRRHNSPSPAAQKEAEEEEEEGEYAEGKRSSSSSAGFGQPYPTPAARVSCMCCPCVDRHGAVAAVLQVARLQGEGGGPSPSPFTDVERRSFMCIAQVVTTALHRLSTSATRRAEKRKLEGALRNMKSEIGELENQLSVVNQEAKSLSDQLAQTTAQEAEATRKIHAMEQQLQALEAERSETRQYIASLEKRTKELSNASSKAAQAEAIAGKLRRELDVNAENLSASQMRLKRLKDLDEKRGKEDALLRDTLSRLREDRLRLVSDISALRSKLTQSRGESLRLAAALKETLALAKFSSPPNERIGDALSLAAKLEKKMQRTRGASDPPAKEAGKAKGVRTGNRGREE